MLIGSYLFHCQFTTPAGLPLFKGSTLRGAFGHSLKKVVCALSQQECGGCLLVGSCVYAFIFEVKKSPPESGTVPARIAARPHPFILLPPLTAQQSYAPGEPFDFGLTLFGRANDYLPHLVYAVEQMGEAGVGRGTKEGQGRFRLLAMDAGENRLYDGDCQALATNHPLPHLELAAPPPEPISVLTVHLLTPLRLKLNNELQETLPFHLLIRAALRRISTLTEAYAGGEPDLDYRGLTRRAAAVTIRKSDCRWVDYRRYSNRQQGEMQLGGVQGSITYEGELAEFLPLLRFCEQVNIGKQTAFGLGRMEIVASEGTTNRFATR